jgi:hypothetical protein
MAFKFESTGSTYLRGRVREAVTDGQWSRQLRVDAVDFDTLLGFCKRIVLGTTRVPKLSEVVLRLVEWALDDGIYNSSTSLIVAMASALRNQMLFCSSRDVVYYEPDALPFQERPDPFAGPGRLVDMPLLFQFCSLPWEQYRALLPVDHVDTKNISVVQHYYNAYTPCLSRVEWILENPASAHHVDLLRVHYPLAPLLPEEDEKLPQFAAPVHD